MSWLPAGSIPVNVEVESKRLRSLPSNMHADLWIIEHLNPKQPFPVRGIFMPRPEWVW